MLSASARHAGLAHPDAQRTKLVELGDEFLGVVPHQRVHRRIERPIASRGALAWLRPSRCPHRLSVRSPGQRPGAASDAEPF